MKKNLERFLRPLKNEIYKCSKKCIGKLDDLVHGYNITYHRTKKMKPIVVQTSTYIDFGVENNDTDPKFEVDDHV